MEALKHAEDGLMVLCGDADAIVFYAEHPNVALPFGGHVHVGMSAILTILKALPMRFWRSCVISTSATGSLGRSE
jgi:hypothetical protein